MGKQHYHTLNFDKNKKVLFPYPLGTEEQEEKAFKYSLKYKYKSLAQAKKEVIDAPDPREYGKNVIKEAHFLGKTSLGLAKFTENAGASFEPSTKDFRKEIIQKQEWELSQLELHANYLESLTNRDNPENQGLYVKTNDDTFFLRLKNHVRDKRMDFNRIKTQHESGYYADFGTLTSLCASLDSWSVKHLEYLNEIIVRKNEYRACLEKAKRGVVRCPNYFSVFKVGETFDRDSCFSKLDQRPVLCEKERILACCDFRLVLRQFYDPHYEFKFFLRKKDEKTLTKRSNGTVESAETQRSQKKKRIEEEQNLAKPTLSPPQASPHVGEDLISEDAFFQVVQDLGLDMTEIPVTRDTVNRQSATLQTSVQVPQPAVGPELPRASLGPGSAVTTGILLGLALASGGRILPY